MGNTVKNIFKFHVLFVVSFEFETFKKNSTLIYYINRKFEVKYSGIKMEILCLDIFSVLVNIFYTVTEHM